MLENIEKLSSLVDKLIDQSINLASNNISLQSSKEYIEDELNYFKKNSAEQETENASLRTKCKKLEDLVSVLQVDIRKIEGDLKSQLKIKEEELSRKEKDILILKENLQKNILLLENKNRTLSSVILNGINSLKHLDAMLPSLDVINGVEDE